MALTFSTGLVNQMLGLSGGSPAGKGFGDIFTKGILKVYGSPRPATADAAETGTLLFSITASGATYTPADGTNGLEWDDPVAGVISKAAAQVWSGTAVGTGTAVWFRFFPLGSSVTGDSTTVPRYDGSVGGSGADLVLTNLAITTGAPQIIQTFDITLPRS